VTELASPPIPDARTASGTASAKLAGRSLLLFDDQLRSMDGHWFEYARSVVKMHSELGVRTTVICHEKFTGVRELEAAGAEVLPLIPRSIGTGDAAGRTGLLQEIRTLVEQSLLYRRILKRHLRDRTYDCVLLPNAMIYDALAWCLLRLRRPKIGRLALLFRFGIGDYRDGQVRFARKLILLRMALRCALRGWGRATVGFLTDSSRLARDYAQVCGIRPEVVPSPRVIEGPHVDRLADPERPLVFATLGYARLAKGIDIYQDAITRLLADGRASAMRFILQWGHDVRRPDGTLYQPNAQLLQSDRIEIVDKPLSSDEYDAIFERIDCMVLPYRRDAYRSQISGIAVEAACAGMPILYTSDTWLEDFVHEQGSGIGVPDGDDEALASAMLAIVRDRTQYLSEALERSATARRMNSPEQFLKLLWRLDMSDSSTGRLAA
jgi:glycosyltransferase involved in cell wall biosynthesis